MDLGQVKRQSIEHGAAFGRRCLLLAMALAFLGLAPTQVFAAALVCRKAQLAVLQAPLNSLFANRDESFVEGYSGTVHIQEFWQTHKRFGFVRSSDGRVILAARNETQVQQIINELRSSSGLKDAKAPRVQDSPLSEGVSVDVTELMGGWIRDKLDFQPVAKGPNCWNFCLMHAEVVSSMRYSSAEEFRHWLSGPFSEPIRNVHDLRPGDIFALMKGPEDLHGAIFISPNLVLSKNGAKAQYGYRLMDIREMLGSYALATDIQAYRLKSWQEIQQRYRIQLPAALSLRWKEVDALELKFHRFFSREAKMDKFLLLEELELYGKSVEFRSISIRIRQLQSIADPTPQEALMLYLWTGLFLRAESLLHFGQ